MDVDAFLQTVSATGMRLSIQAGDSAPRHAPATLDALFHLPLLALAVMIVARRNPFQTVYLGRNVALLLVEHFTALGRSPHNLETSLTLRRRCADALAFLEAAGLVAVSNDQQRIVTLTQSGQKHLKQAARDKTDLGRFVRQLWVNQDRVMARFGNEH